MRIIVKFEKRDEACFISHLDTQRLFQRAFRRADIPLAYSQGFNPHPIMSFASALSLGFSSGAEWLDVRLSEHVSCDEFIERVNASLPPCVKALKAVAAPEGYPALTSVLKAAQYLVVAEADERALSALEAAIPALLSNPIIVQKKTKGGIKSVDIRPMVYRASVISRRRGNVTLDIIGRLDAQGGMRIDLFMGSLEELIGEKLQYMAHRERMYSNDGVIMPQWPLNGERNNA